MRESASEEIRSYTQSTHEPRIALVGIGCAGLNTITRLIEQGLADHQTTVISNSRFHLSIPRAHHKILLGGGDSDGDERGGLDIDRARALARESEHDIAVAVAGCDILFAICGLGDSIGGGVTPIVLNVGRLLGAHTAAFCIWPFAKQGDRMQRLAEIAFREITDVADMTMVFRNDFLLDLRPMPSINKGFEIVDNIAVSVLQGVAMATA